VGTTELGFFALILGGILLAGVLTGAEGPGGFGPSEIWLYVTILTVGYMVSRGLAKAGSSHPNARRGRDRSRRF
jgi:hypothetical protein